MRGGNTTFDTFTKYAMICNDKRLSMIFEKEQLRKHSARTARNADSKHKSSVFSIAFTCSVPVSYEINVD